MIRKLTLIPALLLALAVAGGSSALGAGSVDGAPLDFGRAAVGDTQTKTETLKNISGGDLTIGAVTATGGPFDAAPPGPNNTCTGATLGAGTECSVDVSYSPNGTGGDTGTLTIDEGGADTDTFSLSGTGVAHRFIFTNPPANPDFADTAVGDTSGSKEITVTNNTDYPDNPNVHLGGSDPGDFNESDNCNSSVQPDCTATVSFQPHSQGAKSANLLIDGDSFTFTGTGVEQVTVQPLSLDFGDQHAGTNSSPQPVSISNNSDHSIDLNLQLSGQADYNISGCGGLGGSNNLAGGDTCTIQVVFSPNAPGAQNGTLTVAGQAVALTGRGTTNTINVAPGSLAFGNQPVSTSSATRTVTVTNTGSESLHIGAPTVGGNNPLQFSVSDNCQSASPLLPGDQCTMTVAFIPTTPGSMSATIQVNSDANSGLDTVSLTGTATPSAVAFVPAPVLFERPHHAGTFSTPKTVTLTNRTSGLLTISKVYLGGPNPKSFRITGGNCAGRALAADASCTETVRFAPNEVGVKTANLIVNDDGPNGQHLVQLNGTSTYPKDDAGVHGAAGCNATKITWKRAGSSSRFDRTVIVRSRTHIPTGPGDGTRLPHGAGVLHDRGLSHFTSYDYRVFALYRSHTRPGTLNHSRGVVLRLRTGEICTPMDGGVISDTTPTVSWLRHATLFGYSFRLFHANEQVQQAVSVHATSFTFSGRRRLRHGLTYTLFLYAYPRAHPEGTSIGRTTFRVR